MKTIIKHTISILLVYLCSISLVRAANPECTSPLTSDSSTKPPESPSSSSSTVLVYKEQSQPDYGADTSRYCPSPRELPMSTKSSKVAGLAGINDVLDQTIVLGPEVPHYQNALFTETNLGYDARLNDSIGTTRIAGRLDKTRRLGRVPDIELHTCNPPLPCPNNHGYPCEGIPVRVEHLPNRRSTAVPVQVVQNVSNPDPGYPAGYPKRDGIPVLVEYLPNHGKQGDQGYPCTGDSPVLRGVPVQVEPVQVGQSDDQVVAPRRVSTPQQPLTRIASNPALLAYPQGNQGVGPYQGYPQKGKIQVPVKVERARQVWVAY